MKWIAFWLYVSLIAIAFLFNLLGLMRLYPLYLTAPLLFIVLFFPVYFLNRKNKKSL
ncbi:hypothetical protein [Bacillus sp. FJAT-52991]|uniref:Uncharacterized protein n=1 Tax=Bacillus kandeliae TaxID=3129297 RepID=A0ABZ2N8C6_9BACI